jgi:hypothetical protein
MSNAIFTVRLPDDLKAQLESLEILPRHQGDRRLSPAQFLAGQGITASRRGSQRGCVRL